MDKKQVVQEMVAQFAFRALMKPPQLDVPPFESGAALVRCFRNATEFYHQGSLQNAWEVLQDGRRIISEYPHRDKISEELRGIAKACRAGDVSRADALHTGITAIGHEGVGTTEEEVQGYFRKWLVETIRSLLAEVQSGNYDNLKILLFHIESARDPGDVSFEEMGISEEEFERLKRIQDILV